MIINVKASRYRVPHHFFSFYLPSFPTLHECNCELGITHWKKTLKRRGSDKTLLFNELTSTSRTKTCFLPMQKLQTLLNRERGENWFKMQNEKNVNHITDSSFSRNYKLYAIIRMCGISLPGKV